MATLQEPSKGEDDIQGPSWQAELTFRDWKADLEAARANWASAPTPLKSTLLLHGNDLTVATSWLISRSRDMTPQQQSYIRKSIARSYNSAAEEHRLQDAERKKRLKSWISFGATVSAFVLFLGLELALYDLWVKVTGATYVAQAPSQPVFSTPRMPQQEEMPSPAAAAPASVVEHPADLPSPPPERQAEFVAPPMRQAAPSSLAERALEEARRGALVRARLIALEALADADPKAPIEGAMVAALTAVQHTQMSVRPLTAHANPAETMHASITGNGTMALLIDTDQSVRWASLAVGDSGGLGAGAGSAKAVQAVGRTIVALDESSVAFAGVDEGLRLWPAGAPQPVSILRGHEAGVTALAMSRDRLTVATTSWDETIRLWDVATGRNRMILRGHQGPALSAAFSADGQRLVTAGEDRTARIWTVANGGLVTVLRGHDSPVEVATFDRSGRRVLTTSLDGSARLWDAATGVETAALRMAGGPVFSAAFSASGRRVVTMAPRGRLAVWDTETGQAIADHDLQGIAVRSYAVAGAHEVLLVLTSGGVVLLRDSGTSAHLGLLEAPDGDRIASASFSADGGSVIALSARQQVLTWPTPMPLPALLAQLRDSAPRCLSLAERAELQLEAVIPRWCTDMDKPTNGPS